MTIKQMLAEMADDAEDSAEMQAELIDWLASADDDELAEMAEFLAKPYFADEADEEPEGELEEVEE